MRAARTKNVASAASAKPPTCAAIGGHGRDSIMQRVTSDGRVVTFIATDLIPGRPLRLWGALAEISGSAGAGVGAFIRLGILGAHDGWSMTQLLAVALARFEAERARTGEAEVACPYSALRPDEFATACRRSHRKY